MAPQVSSTAQAIDKPLSRDRDLDRVREERLLGMRLNMLARQARRYPLPVLISAAFLAIVVWRHVPGALITAWVVGLGVILLARWIYCGRAEHISDYAATRAALRTLLMLSIANGVITGMAVVFFFHRLPPDLQSIFSMVMVCWAAGAVSANAAYSPAFYAYVIPILAPLAVVWAAGGSFEGVGIAVLILLFLLIQAWLAGDNNRMLKGSFDVSFENEQLLRELEAQQRTTLRERDRAEAANRSKNQFLAAASHDLRQPLSAVSLLAGNLDDERRDQEVRKIGRNIGIAIDAVERQLTGLLDIARLDAEVTRPREDVFALKSVFDEAIEIEGLFASRHGLTLGCSVDPSLSVRTDRVLFGRIVRNLVHNAINYTVQGRVKLAARLEPEALVVDVSDTGCGIPSEQQARIFEEFYQIDGATAHEERGLGLGLAIVKRFTRLLGLGLDLVSAPGVGSTFSITIPLQRVEGFGGSQSASMPKAEVSLPPGLRVLVVDDDVDVRAAMAGLLAQWGCEVLQAGNAQDALEVTASRPPHFVVADYRLSPDETGIDAIELLRARHGYLRALIVTAHASPEALRQADASGLPILDKSSDRKELKATIAEVLSHTGTGVDNKT
jgi:signal transduction histidine kinase/ActR/RegA family two-component response regulator